MADKKETILFDRIADKLINVNQLKQLEKLGLKFEPPKADTIPKTKKPK